MIRNVYQCHPSDDCFAAHQDAAMSYSVDANEPQPLGSSTIAADISDRQAVYLPPSELSTKYAKGIHRHVEPMPQAVGRGKHLIKTIEEFYVRPRWLFVRVRVIPPRHA